MSTHSPRLNRAVLAAAGMMVMALGAHAAPAPSIPGAPQTAAATKSAADIHDIRGPKPITSPWLIPLTAVTALLAVGGAYAAWAWNRRRFRESSNRPLDIALERLEKARQLMAPPHGREFSIEVSSVVRDYIESRFDLLATHLTTDEFLHQLLEPVDSLLAAHQPLLEHFLQTCDLAKFGGWNLAATDMEVMLQSARQFIVESASEGGSHGNQSDVSVPADRPSTSASRETYVSLPST